MKMKDSIGTSIKFLLALGLGYITTGCEGKIEKSSKVTNPQVQRQTEQENMDLEKKVDLSKLAPQEERIVIYTALNESSNYTSEEFRLAEEFLKQKIGMDFKFEFCSKDDIKQYELNHRTRFALLELGPEELGRLMYNQAKDLKLTKEQEEELDERIKRNIKEFDKKYKDVKPEKITDQDIQDLYIEEMDNSVGLSDPRTGTFYLVRSKQIDKLEEMVRLSNKVVKMASILGKDSKDYKEAVEGYNTLKSDLQKQKVKTIVHELFHTAGLLWHSHEFSDDEIEEFVDPVNKIPNVMSYQPVGKGRFGFDMTDSQIRQVRDYISGGKTFQHMKYVGYDPNQFIRDIQKQHGYKE